MNVGYAEAALAELESIVNFYAAESPVLANRFRLDLQRAEELLALNPLAGHLVSNGYRRLLFRVFPFGFIYCLNGRLNETGESIEIIAIAHQHRRPGYWQNRIHEESAVYQLAA